jgi:ketosteroid isomerase-like protein
MPQESTTPDVVLMRCAFAAGNRHDLDAVVSLYAPDAVWNLSDAGLGTFEGLAAIGSFLGEWWGTWGGHVNEVNTVRGRKISRIYLYQELDQALKVVGLAD